ncbi:lipopolysaccharide biosynthesis protein [Enterobacterales bacterium BD_CKDN230030183-1A_HGKHYDSX7]
MNPKGVYFGIASNIFGNMLMLAATLWLTRILDPEQFGQFRVGSNFAVLVLPFLALGGERLVSRLIQRHANEPHYVTQALIAVATITAGGVLLLACAFPVLSDLLFDNKLPMPVYYISLAIVPLTIAYNLGNTLWRHTGDVGSAQIDMNFTQRVVRAPLLISGALIFPSALTASAAMTLAQAISLFRIRHKLTYFAVDGAGRIGNALRANGRDLLLIGMPIAIMAAVDRIDVLLVNYVMGVARAGSYDLIYMLSLTAMFPAMALSKTAEPFLYGLADDAVKLHRLQTLQTRAFFLSCAALVGIGVVGPILSRFLGNAGPDFASAAIALSAGLAFSSVHGPVIEYLQINGKSRLTLMVVVILLGLFIILKYFAAAAGSLTLVATMAGLFYFTLRLLLSTYIRMTDKVTMARPSLIVLSILGYATTLLYVFYCLAERGA